MIKGLIFDVDGVIAQTAQIHYQIWKQIVATIGIKYDEDVNAQFKGLARLDTLQAILDHYHHPPLSKQVMQKLTAQKNTLYVQMLNKVLSPADILPGILPLLQAARSSGLKLAVASSSRNAPLILKRLEISQYFDFIVDPLTIKRGKPDPEIYLAAARGINLNPWECIGFEDATAGIIGLAAAQIQAVAITHGDPGPWTKATLVYRTPAALDLATILQTMSHN